MKSTPRNFLVYLEGTLCPKCPFKKKEGYCIYYSSHVLVGNFHPVKVILSCWKVFFRLCKLLFLWHHCDVNKHHFWPKYIKKKCYDVLHCLKFCKNGIKLLLFCHGHFSKLLFKKLSPWNEVFPLSTSCKIWHYQAYLK